MPVGCHVSGKVLRLGVVWAAVLLVVTVSLETIGSCQAVTDRLQVGRVGKNLAANPTVATAAHWHVAGDAIFDASISRTADGSGSFRLSTPYKTDPRHAGRVASDLIPVPSPGKYTLGFFAKTANGPGDMRLRLYNAILLGAKAMGYWRDCYGSCAEKYQKSVGPVDRKPWWPDFPNLRREVDQLLPIIRQPHGTPWTVSVSPRGGMCGYARFINLLRSRLNRKRTTVRHRVARVSGQIDDDLLELTAV